MSDNTEIILGRDPDITLEVGDRPGKDLELEIEPDLVMEMSEEGDIELTDGGGVDLELEESYPGTPTGTYDYNELIHKPKINGVTLVGNKELSDLIDFLVIDGHDAAWVTGEGAIPHDID